MRQIAGALAAVVATLGSVLGAAWADPPVSAALHGLSVELVNRDTLRLVLHAERIPEDAAGRVSGQLLVVGGIPLPTAPLPAVSAGETGSSAVTLDVLVPTVPAAVLELPVDDVPLRWQGLDSRGRVVVDVAGRITTGEGGNLFIRESATARGLAHLADHTVRLRGLGVAAQLLVRLHNPMGFEVTVARLQYVVSVGGVVLVAGERPGLRLRPRQNGDMLIEAEVPLTDLAAGVVAAVVQRLPIHLDGVVWLRTPGGDRGVPFSVTGGL